MTMTMVSSVTCRRRLSVRSGVRETRAGRRRRQSHSTERRCSNKATTTDNDDEEQGATASFRCVRLGDDDEDTFDNLPGACAAVRTRSFYEFGEDADADSDARARSFKTKDDADDDSNRLPVDIKARLDWWSDRILSEKLREAKFQRMGMRVITFAALVPSDSAGLVHSEYAVDASANPNNRESAVDVEALRRWSVVTDTASTTPHAPHHVVVGTMDVHIGDALVGESLVGCRPLDHSADGSSRAYAFNVCVAPEFRGHGVAESLFTTAIDTLASDHPAVRVLYVHVEVDNASAIRAYEKARFILEAAEEPDRDPSGGTRRALLYRDVPNLVEE
jgi:ribosomal protein S18 acetylase RimI-like enzyme